ncbi:MAG: glycosyltransferase family 1 protein [Bacteroidetes bacterium]|nr:glycosyltransferase family 1 protein [Bacteroidota bacterium]
MKISEKHIHIISFDIPFPADYGGVIDVYYKIVELNKAGYSVILHCFEYGRAHSEVLSQLCKKVYYYKRNIYKNPFTGNTPYIISTRNNSELLENLLLDKHPILFEGLHTCFYLTHEQLTDRVKMVRTHNIEHEYYKNLESVETNYIKKLFFKKESERLELFEPLLKHANHIFSISLKDTEYFKKTNSNCTYLPAFHQNSQVTIETGTVGDFALYHGNLGVGENDEAAKYIVKEIWNSDFQIPLVIAGNNASKELRSLCRKNKNISLVSPTNSSYINHLIKNAQLNILLTFQATGIKLKLINSLFQGRHCLVNKEMIENTGLESVTHLSDPSHFRDAIEHLFIKPFTAEELHYRENILKENFNNEVNVTILTQYLERYPNEGS